MDDMDTAAERGLNMSLDAMIKERKVTGGGAGGGRGGGRGGRGGGGSGGKVMALRGRATRNQRAAAPYTRNQNGGGGGGGGGGYNNGARGGRHVYVGNLSYDVTWKELKDFMKEAGNVLRADVILGPDGRSKGYGLVEFKTATEAARAITTFNDLELMGRNIFIREDREAGGSGGGNAGFGGGGGGGGGRGGGGRGAGGNRLYVGNLAWDVTWQDLKDHMRTVGNVLHADIITGADGRSKGCALVEFSNANEAKRAIETLTDTELKGRLIFVREDREVDTACGCRVYVGNLSWDVAWQDLKDHMRSVGNVVRADVLLEKDGKRSKGCGVVEFSNPKEALKAINQLNDTDLKGRPIFVREDREDGASRTLAGGGGMARGSGGGGGGGGGGYQIANAAGRQVYVGNIAYGCTWQSLKDHFKGCGEVQYVEIPPDRQGRSSGYGLVRFAQAKDADKAIATMNDTDLMGRLIFVREDRELTPLGGK